MLKDQTDTDIALNEYTIGLDTSNYTTSCAVFDGRTGVNSGRPLDVPENALGLRQSDALFMHVKYLPEVFSRLPLGSNVIAVGASAAPRETEGSYMPCFLAGVSHGEVIARSLGKPFRRFSHQQGHAAAAAWSAGRQDLLDAPMLCWHLSGGTTELLLVKPSGATVTCEAIGGTSDISCGQLADRTGNLLGLKFPSGAALDELASSVSGGVEYSPKTENLTFSLSGAEHKVKAMLERGAAPGEAAYFVFSAMASAIKKVTELARRQYGDIPLLLSGGVASSRFLRRAMPDGIYAAPEYSADNAMGIAILTFRAEKGSPSEPDSLYEPEQGA